MSEHQDTRTRELEAAARAMFDYHHGGSADYDPNFAWMDLDDSARDYWRELAEAALSHSPAEVERLRQVLRSITTAGWDGNWAADVAREALEAGER
jgi:hypothetical protein